ncbi:DUF2288 family protein [Roseibacillus ishigakijimensis]|uniref:DUF2288 family protein n=1 Tax=Roseibacillus ishigakijimensis TaxID=454146 RepID=A0A934RSZ9_9BACT|nr:DUF2288 family protein [Roseibacillus ishigakijimensis]MBK1833655.1 DUF2288 family protein [Roseibacillus ishigakijimensis]
MISQDPSQPEPMKYAMLGEDTATDAEKLAKFQGEVDWSYLKPHYERDCLYFVDPELDMTTVGEAMAKDDSAAVKGWLKSGDLVKIEALHVFQWEESDTRFEALVISPFVLCRPL